MGQGSGIAMSCGISHRGGSDPELLWLWHKLTATSPVQPLALEPPYAMGAVQKRQRPKKKKEKKRKTLNEKEAQALIP